MRRGLLFAVLAAAAVAAAPGESQAFGHRRRAVVCPPVCPAPAVYYGASYCYPAGSVYYPAPYYRGGSPYAYVPTPGVESAAVPRTVIIRNKQYRIIPDPDRGDHAEDEEDKAAEDLVVAKTANIPTADRFSGTSRRIAKTTIFKGPVDPEFNTLGELLDSLPAHKHMAGLGISKAPNSNRVAEEQKNVRVTAFIYAFKKEPDKDYHVILGDAPGTPNQRYMNVEISGIPIAGTDENRDRLWAVRNEFKSAFGLGASGPGSYFRPNPPVPVKITGSLFWDVDHSKSFVGPQSHKPKTAWELHPVSAIEFLD